MFSRGRKREEGIGDPPGGEGGGGQLTSALDPLAPIVLLLGIGPVRSARIGRVRRQGTYP